MYQLNGKIKSDGKSKGGNSPSEGSKQMYSEKRKLREFLVNKTL